jgi:hypothetical protein
MDADTLAAIKAEHVPVMDEDAHYDVCACCDADWPCAASALVAEVERLRTACDALYADADRHANATIHAELEVERLRAALDEIDHHTYGWSFDTAVPMVDRIRLTARAALASDR